VDAKLIFWTLALVDLAAVAALAANGVRQRRRGDVKRHARNMILAASLVLLFLVAYLAKVQLLGHEDLAVWSPLQRWILWIHEACVFTMLIAGAAAGQRALRLRRTRNATGDPGDPPAPARLASWHRRAGWTAVSAAGLGVATAALVLAGMYERAGLL
jgi:uncharacterized membrane protein YozB (DUF420 family)